MEMDDFAIALSANPAGNITELTNGSASRSLGDHLCYHRGHRFRVITSEGQGHQRSRIG
jgi:hypothetical protein